ncbi:MAG: YigZ family protein [Flavobacteriaceae bacterium]|nr:YigZ family protein [Flavobacteriaceae bacterium]
MSISDTYKTIKKSATGEIFKDKGSKFLGHTFPVSNEEQIKLYIDILKENHHKARHWCYAWRLGLEKFSFRANDDGEPNNSAGNPIYGQILSNGLTNVLVVVVRYFGGTKLGVGGLINAYKTSARFAIEASQVIQKTIDVDFELKFEYADMNKIMRVIKEKEIHIVSQKMNVDCNFKISVRKKEAKDIKKIFEELRCVKVKKV